MRTAWFATLEHAAFRAMRALVAVAWAGTALAADPAPVVVPADTLYVCVTDANGVRSQAPIEFAPNVYSLCARHPEMGPCQYARSECRRGGGRVFAAGGIEITMKTEADYDKRVMRVRIQ